MSQESGTRTLYAYAGASNSREVVLSLHPTDALMATYPTQGIDRCVVADQATKNRFRIEDAGMSALRAFPIKKPRRLRHPDAELLAACAEERLGADLARRISEIALTIRSIGASRYTLRDLCELLCTCSDTTASEIESILRNNLADLMGMVGSPMTLADGGRADLLMINVLVTEESK